MPARFHSAVALLFAFHVAACGSGACHGTQAPTEPQATGSQTTGAQTTGAQTTGAQTTGPQDAPWARHALLGRCFPAARDFVESLAGPQGLTDENIRVRPATPLPEGSTWVIDQTPQTNHEWYLLQPGGKDELCLTLFVPAAAQVLLAQGEEGQSADAQTQASPGFPAKAVHFVRRAGERSFSPVTCTEIRFEGEDVARKDVPCAGFFD